MVEQDKTNPLVVIMSEHRQSVSIVQTTTVTHLLFLANLSHQYSFTNQNCIMNIIKLAQSLDTNCS